MTKTEGRQEVSMSAVTGKNSDGAYRYYARGESEPFTGILYSKFPNGQYDSWQEYVDGVGQGTWINYYENGNYREVGTYEQNRVEGPIKKYHPNGVLQAEGTYKDWRIRIGVWKYYDEEGQLLDSVDYGEKGSIEEVKEFFERGEISASWYARIRSENGF
jgi:antitoxin component YwqK of YwqJK toxin-antitoxin module